MNHKKYFDKTETAKVKVLVNGDKVSVLLPTVSDKRQAVISVEGASSGYRETRISKLQSEI